MWVVHGGACGLVAKAIAMQAEMRVGASAGLEAAVKTVRVAVPASGVTTHEPVVKYLRRYT